MWWAGCQRDRQGLYGDKGNPSSEETDSSVERRTGKRGVVTKNQYEGVSDILMLAEWMGAKHATYRWGRQGS